jgi:hypothetical protein
MTDDQRPPIPTALKRQLLVEAGHRCSIPTCRQTPIELAHIVAWSVCKTHTFDNLIVLCPTCHTRYDRGEIDRKAMLNYKHNLCVINSRYGDFEQRVLRVFAEKQQGDQIALPGGLDIMLMYLLQDGLLADTGQNSGIFMNNMPSQKIYELTEQGRKFINKWLNSDEIE